MSMVKPGLRTKQWAVFQQRFSFPCSPWFAVSSGCLLFAPLPAWRSRPLCLLHPLTCSNQMQQHLLCTVIGTLSMSDCNSSFPIVSQMSTTCHLIYMQIKMLQDILVLVALYLTEFNTSSTLDPTLHWTPRTDHLCSWLRHHHHLTSHHQDLE